MAQDIKYEMGLARNAIVDITDVEPTITGGGRGWRASVPFNGGEFAANSTSKLGALQTLLAMVQNEGATEAEPTGKPRITVEETLARLTALFGEYDVEDETDDRTPGPKWKGTTLISIVPCVGECMGAHPNSPCDCRCGGSNHAIGGLFMFPILEAAVAKVAVAETAQDRIAAAKALKAALVEARPVRYEPKPCLCGCGGLTLRRFVPGHDARYHAAIKGGFASVAEWSTAREATRAAKATRAVKASA